MRICSLLPSATEIVADLGLIDALVGVSEECRWPDQVVGKPVVSVASIDPAELSSREIDEAVRASLREGRSLYAVDAELIEALAPDVILTQDLCTVCAVSSGELASACPVGAEVVSLDPRTLGDVADSVRTLGARLGVATRGEELAAAMLDAVEQTASAVRGLRRPRVFFAEWIDPPFCAGHWLPEMIERAGALDVLGRPGSPSRSTSWDEVIALEPELVVLGPCGFGVEEALRRADALRLPCDAVVVDGDAYYSRPAPRLADGVRQLAHLFHPGAAADPGLPAVRLAARPAAGRNMRPHAGNVGVDEHEAGRAGADAIRLRAYELSQRAGGGTDVENWLQAERELAVAHDYDTVDRDLERSGMTISRLPLEAGVVWRLCLPRGEQVEQWEPGNAGLTLPGEIARLVDAVVGGKALVPGPPLTREPGALRLREMLEEQRRALLAHDPGSRLGRDPENLHQHRVASRRTRAFLRATRAYLDPAWVRTLTAPLGELAEVTGPVRDLDVLLEHVRREIRDLAGIERAGGGSLVALLEHEREALRRDLLAVLEGNAYRSLLSRLQLPPRLAPGVDAVRLERVARKEFRRLAGAVGRLGKHPEDAAVHGLRIRLKRARYAAELAAPTGEVARRFAEDAKALQTLLGEYQDAVVAEERLRASAIVDEQTAAAFVAGRLAERQTGRRRSVAERLPAVWKRLRRSGALLG